LNRWPLRECGTQIIDSLAVLPAARHEARANQERSNMIKIKVSYERPEELRRILEKLHPDVKSWKASRDQKGHFLKAYIIME